METAYLEIIKGADEGQILPLKEEPFTIGRGPGNKMRLEDSTVSRQHLKFFLSGERRYVADLNSTHGTWVNNDKITRHELRDGDEIRLGEHVLRFRFGNPYPSSQPEGLTDIGEDPFADDQGHAAPELPKVEMRAAPPAARPRAPAPTGGTPVTSVPRALQVGGRFGPKQRTKSKDGVLHQDLDQRSATTRWAAILLATAAAIGIGWGAMTAFSFLLSTSEDEAPAAPGPQRPQRPQRPNR